MQEVKQKSHENKRAKFCYYGFFGFIVSHKMLVQLGVLNVFEHHQCISHAISGFLNSTVFFVI